MTFGDELIEKVLDGQKTVTRRPVKYSTATDGSCEPEPLPCRYKVGKTYAIQPVIKEGPGKGRGGKEVGRLKVLNVDRQRLGLRISDEEARREGFNGPTLMLLYWCGLHCSWNPNQLVDRIEFELASIPIEGEGR
jgi:hypothetical protein